MAKNSDKEKRLIYDPKYPYFTISVWDFEDSIENISDMLKNKKEEFIIDCKRLGITDDEIDQIHDIRLDADISYDDSYFVFRTYRYETDDELVKRLNYKKEQDAKKKEIEKLKNDPDYKTYTYLKEKFKTCL